MAKERLKSPRARLFVALDLPDELRGAIATWQRTAFTDPALRAMPSQSLHITLCFLGYQPEKAISRIAAIVEGIEPRPVPLRLEAEPRPLPRGRPRLFTLDIASEEAIGLQSELSDALQAARFYEPEKRAFWPHVTVARVRSERLAPKRGERRGKGRPRKVASPPLPLPEELVANARSAVRLALYRSNLKPQGAEYVPLAGVDLPPAEGGAGKR